MQILNLHEYREMAAGFIEMDRSLSCVEWVDGYEPVEVHLNSEITDESVAEFESDFRDAEKSGQTCIPVVIHSPGGCMYSAFKIVDIIRGSRVPVTTIIKGCAMSAAAMIFSCGDVRVIGPNASLMMHSVRASGFGETTLQELEVDLNESRRLQDKMCAIMAQNCDKRPSFFKTRLEKRNTDVYMSPQESLNYNLATHIGTARLITKIEMHTEIEIDQKPSRKRKF